MAEKTEYPLFLALDGAMWAVVREEQGKLALAAFNAVPLITIEPRLVPTLQELAGRAMDATKVPHFVGKFKFLGLDEGAYK